MSNENLDHALRKTDRSATRWRSAGARWLRPALVVLLSLAPMLAACEPGTFHDVDPVTELRPVAGEVASHLDFIPYREQWDLWPGTSELYEGQSPHGAFLTTYTNEPAQRAIRREEGSLPKGSIIVKENYDEQKELASLTVMFKAGDGFDPEHNDWFWMKELADGTIEASGKVESCIGCHAKRAANDYLFTSDVGGLEESKAQEGPEGDQGRAPEMENEGAMESEQGAGESRGGEGAS